MGTLVEDMATYADEVYTKRDLKAGIKLISEIAGLVAVGGFLLAILTSWLPVVGIVLSAATVARIMFYSGRIYLELDEDQRKTLRAAVRWIKGGFDLEQNLIGDE